jgi:hypothetical protein
MSGTPLSTAPLSSAVVPVSGAVVPVSAHEDPSQPTGGGEDPTELLLLHPTPNEATAPNETAQSEMATTAKRVCMVDPSATSVSLSRPDRFRHDPPALIESCAIRCTRERFP